MVLVGPGWFTHPLHTPQVIPGRSPRWGEVERDQLEMVGPTMPIMADTTFLKGGGGRGGVPTIAASRSSASLGRSSWYRRGDPADGPEESLAGGREGGSSGGPPPRDPEGGAALSYLAFQESGMLSLTCTSATS